ncbi:hypothetical protein DZA28_10570 [Pseudomonas alloputida]|uniref:Ig-like domain repeat protein n=2 Tax=Pseudomonas TaxID=286 RepID=A0ABD6MWJ2_9PSED|nr:MULTISPECIES: hypothetical protein [Pseudomonas]EKT4479172.1 hypothetical protein [Pseudomonas putida]MDD2142488.1 hypothetical protein [Pseudomonas putida]MDD2148654.1 hypothetical protein [Pseudomonas putida]NWL45519.1 hypothetical protein [Pseudomonas hunanensis]TRZ60367.1 hypothetical protein DZA28_10570 [Pseudomonas alloputida]
MSSMPPGDPGLLLPAEVPALLEDIPGGDHNLLPVVATEQALAVVVPMWPVSYPQPGEPDVLQLFWNDDVVAEKSWESEVPPEDLIFSVPVEKLVSGAHELRYEVTGTGGMSPSEVLELLIDLAPPALGGERGMLTIVEDADEIERDGLTERYLRNHGQRLRTEVPRYTTPVAGDTIIYYWDDESLDENEVDRYEVGYEDISGPFYIDFESEMILQRGDGNRYLHYAIKDRAGNLSAFSKPLKVAVSAGARTFPLPDIEQVEGTGGQLRLALNDLELPLLVVVPADALVYPDEALRVEWGEPGDPGYFSATTGYEGQERAFEIPVQKIAAQSGITTKVKFVASGDKRHDYPSPAVDLFISPLSKNLPRVQLDGVASNNLSLSKAPDRIPVTLGTWPLMADGQFVDIWVTGALNNGGDAEPFQVLKDYEVKPADLIGGIGQADDVVVLKSYLQTLELDVRFTLHVQVRFAAQGVPVNFPLLSPTLIP